MVANSSPRTFDTTIYSLDPKEESGAAIVMYKR
jgi:hypothetical protein